LDQAPIRLARVDRDWRIWLARGEEHAEEVLHMMHRDENGGGASAARRSSWIANGAMITMSSSSYGHGPAAHVVFGVVADHVMAVRVGDVEATLSNNVFIADVPVAGPIVITTPSGKRTIWAPS
jgi:hypothetical protein